VRPISFVLASTDHGPMIVNRLDIAQDAAGTIFGVGGQLFARGCFDPDEVTTGLEILADRRETQGDGVVALDIGANIGVFTLEWARAMTGWGEVVAFEPQDRLFYALAGNVALHNAYNVRPIHAAVGAESGSMMIPRPNYLRAGSYGSLELRYRGEKTEFIGQAVSYDEADLVPVILVELDGYELPRVDLIKIDVEGMELDVLAGAAKTLARCRPSLIIEWIKVGLPAIVKALKPHDYVLQVVGLNVYATPGKL
jgi:FkbM family methyltransferase